MSGEKGPGLFQVIEDVAPETPSPEPRGPTGSLVTIIETDSTEPIRPTLEQEPTVISPTEPKRGFGAGAYAFASAVLVLAIYWILEIASWAHQRFLHPSLKGYILAPFVALSLLLIGRCILSEVRGWRRLATVDRLRPDLSETGHGAADRERFLAAAKRLNATLDSSSRAPLAHFLATTNPNHGADELRVIFEHDVARPMDEAALIAVQRAVQQIFFLGLVSPSTLIDTFAFLFRAAGMIRAVASAYGQRPGRLGLFRLARRMVADVTILAGVMIIVGRSATAIGETVRQGTKAAGGVVGALGLPGAAELGNVVGDVVGGVADAASAEIAEALAAATRMAQLGLLAVAVCRPTTLDQTIKSELSRQLRRMVFTLARGGAPAAG